MFFKKKKKEEKEEEKQDSGSSSRLVGGLRGGGICILICSKRARRVAQDSDQVQLIEPDQIFRSRGLQLFLLEDEIVVILGVKARVNPL